MTVVSSKAQQMVRVLVEYADSVKYLYKYFITGDVGNIRRFRHHNNKITIRFDHCYFKSATFVLISHIRIPIYLYI